MADEQIPAPEPRRREAQGNPWAFQIGAFLAAVYMVLAVVVNVLLEAELHYSENPQPSLWLIRLVLVLVAFIPATLVSSGTGLRGSARARRGLLLFLIFAGLSYLIGIAPFHLG